jgi:ribosome-associated protein
MPRELAIPDDELELSATRSGGAGGQHVNTSSTRVEVRWRPSTSRVLTDEEKARVTLALGGRLDSEGWLRVVSSETRSQVQNRVRGIARLHDVVAKALVVKRKRKPTKPSRASKQARLDDKKAASKRKANRRRGAWE